MGMTHHGGGAPYKTNESGLRKSGHADQGDVQSLGFGLKRGFVPLITAPDVDETVARPGKRLQGFPGALDVGDSTHRHHVGFRRCRGALQVSAFVRACVHGPSIEVDDVHQVGGFQRASGFVSLRRLAVFFGGI